MMCIHDCSAPMNEMIPWMVAEDEHADHRAQDVAAATRQQGAADDDHRDHVEFGADSVARIAALENAVSIRPARPPHNPLMT